MSDAIAQAALARRSLLDFATLVYPRFESPPHLRLIAGLLERIERGELRRLMINVPVRHGKSVLCSQVFPPWYVGRNPDRNLILCSHSEELAVRNSRVAKHLVEDDRWPFETKLSADSTAAGRWNTKQGGGVYAIGVGGSVTGRGADVLVVDDALHDGLSVVERESAYRWYSEVAFPRLEPGGSVIMIGARFAEDDLCGRILESEDGPNWTVVNLPVLARENDPLGRAPGEALWPERMNVAEVEMRRIAMGSRAFGAQLMQEPTPSGGAFFKLDWFDRRYEGGIPKRRTWENRGIEVAPGVYSEAITGWAPAHVLMAVDCASKTGIANDYSVIATLVTDEVDIFVADIVRERLEFTDLTRKIQETALKWGPGWIFIEDASAGIAVTQELMRWTGLRVIPVTPHKSKIARAEAMTGLFEAKRIRLPESAPWIDVFLKEFLSFPNGRHDDIVDAVVLGVTKAEAIIQQAVIDANNAGTLAHYGFRMGYTL